MKKIVINSASPSVNKDDINSVNKAITLGWGKKMNFYIDEFSKNFSKFKKIKYVLPVSHCTDSIHLALLALGISKGDEVIVPDLTWVASASPIVAVGAKPVFADIDPNSWCLSLETIKKRITKKTKAVIVVDLLGNMPEWDEILSYCKKKNIIIIEDASEAIGSYYKNKPSGKFGVISLFSFNATKLIMSGQGGALCTNDKKLFLKAKLHSHHGMRKDGKKYYWPEVLGSNYSWTNMQASLANSQLKRIKKLINYKKRIFKYYSFYLKDLPDLEITKYSKNIDSDCWIISVILNEKLKIKKEIICKKMKKFLIDIRPMFYTLSSTPAFKKYCKKNYRSLNPIAYRISDYGICLPNGYDLSRDKVKYICESLKKVILECKN